MLPLKIALSVFAFTVITSACIRNQPLVQESRLSKPKDSLDLIRPDLQKQPRLFENPPKNQNVTDSFKTFRTDNYRISNEMINKHYSEYKLLRIKVGNTYSIEKCWFRNDSLDQTLVIQLATDYHRYIIFHFDNKNVPTDLINKIEFHTANGELASMANAIRDFGGFMDKSYPISAAFFESEKGVEIGMSLNQAIKMYNKPDSIQDFDGFTKISWNFTGNEFKDSVTSEDKPLARNSFGHRVVMYFRDNKLVAQILINEIP